MAKATDNQILEKAIGGIPLVRDQGLNTNKGVNFSGTKFDSTGNFNYGVAEITGATGASATIGLTGAAAGGPTTAAQDGWMKVQIAGTSVWVPVWK